MPLLFETDLSNPFALFLLIGFMFITITARYFLVAGIFFLIFHSKRKSGIVYPKINSKNYPPYQFRKEITNSVITAIIFAFVGSLTVFVWQKGYTSFYKDVDLYGYFYLPASVLIYMFVHETYYYWTHRLMHHPKLFKYIHKVHHKSYIPSPWTAFSFHPYESIIEALILPLMILFIPIHHYALLTYLMIMTFSSVINHLDIELFPAGMENHWIGKWFIGATHHSLHHNQMKHNFGLYFTFWDKWQKTESPDFLALFKSKSSKSSKAV